MNQKSRLRFTKMADITRSSVSSGYIPLKTQWVDEGFPGRVDALSITNSRSQARSCANAHQEGDSVTVNQGSESTDATVAKIGAGIAVLVEIGVSIPATTLNDISTTWDNTIQPTVTSYFGSVPDIDDTCTVSLDPLNRWRRGLVATSIHQCLQHGR